MTESGLVVRMRDGFHSNKYKDVDYEALRQLARHKKDLGSKYLQASKKLTTCSTNIKDKNILKRHHAIWNKECLRLNKLKKTLTADLGVHRKDCMDDKFYRDLDVHLREEENAFQQFKSHTVSPLWQLREDLKSVISTAESRVRSPDYRTAVLAEIEGVFKKQKSILDMLACEESDLEKDIRDMSLGLGSEAVDTGIPGELLEAECAYDNMKALLLEEFILLDADFTERLHDLDDSHADVRDSPAHGTWSPADHHLFVVLFEQYPKGMRDRRQLFLDRIQRHIPDIKDKEILSHEAWYVEHKYYHERRRCLVHDWNRARGELHDHNLAVFADINQHCAQARREEESRDHQLEHCDRLYGKMKEWREKRLQQLEEEHARARELLLASETELHHAEAQDHTRRYKDKEKLRQFHEEQIKHMEASRQQQLDRLQRLEAELAVQQEHDQHRVNYRRQLAEAREEERGRQETQQAEEHRARQRQLERLREQVRPVVGADPVRALGDTQATRHRSNHAEEGRRDPLFAVHTFTSEQITADPRVKVENRLREAGLHNTEYARRVVADVKPPREPRKGLESSIFK